MGWGGERGRNFVTRGGEGRGAPGKMSGLIPGSVRVTKGVYRTKPSGAENSQPQLNTRSKGGPEGANAAYCC